MAFISIPDTALVRLVLSCADQVLKQSITLYFRKAGFTKEDLVDLLSDLAGLFLTELKAVISDDYTFEYFEAYDMRSVDGYKVTNTLGVTGSRIGDGVSPGLSCVVTFRTDKRGKWNQGRNYVPGLTEGDVDILNIDPSTVSGILDAYETLLDTPPTGWAWVVASRYQGGLPRVVGVTENVTKALVRTNRYGSQRRRIARG